MWAQGRGRRPLGLWQLRALWPAAARAASQEHRLLPCAWKQAFPGGSAIIRLPGQAMQETGVRSRVGNIPWRRKWHYRLENPIGRGACRATVHGVTKELDMT